VHAGVAASTGRWHRSLGSAGRTRWDVSTPAYQNQISIHLYHTVITYDSVMSCDVSIGQELPLHTITSVWLHDPPNLSTCSPKFWPSVKMDSYKYITKYVMHHLCDFYPRKTRRSKDPRGLCYGDMADWLARWLAGWLAGWLDVTRRYCMKTVKPIWKLFRPTESPITLVSSDPCADIQFQGKPLQRGR